MNGITTRPMGMNAAALESKQTVKSTEPGDALPAALSSKTDFGDGMILMFKLMATLQNDNTDLQKVQIDAAATVKTNLVHDEQQRQLQELQQQGGEGFFECVGNLLIDNLKDVLTLNVEGLVKDNTNDMKTMVESPRFADDLKKVCAATGEAIAIVVGAVVTVCSFGTASPAAVALVAVSTVLCTAAFVEQNCHVLEAAGVDAKTAQWIGIGCAAGGAIAGIAGGAVGGATTLVQATQASVDVVGGLATAASAAHAYDAERAHIATTAVRQAIGRMQQIIENLVGDVKESSKQAAQSKTQLTQSLQTYFESRMIPLAGVRS